MIFFNGRIRYHVLRRGGLYSHANFHLFFIPVGNVEYNVAYSGYQAELGVGVDILILSDSMVSGGSWTCGIFIYR